MKRGLLQGAIILALSCVLLLLAEGVLRVALFVRADAWPKTRIVRFYEDIRTAMGAYAPHPWLNAAPREGAAVNVFGRSLSFNSLGYRSPERPLTKPDGTVRILCSGGSTTLDLLALDDESTWPWLLEGRLRDRGFPGGAEPEVWNAGFNGWTSLENTVSLAVRDLDLDPDLVILFQGLNDLQAAGHRPFDRQYRPHAHTLSRSLGFELGRPPWWEHSLLYERTRDLVYGPRNPWNRLAAPPPEGLADAIDPQGVAIFRRNVRSFLALAWEREIPVVLVTQAVRVRTAHREEDRRWLEEWTGVHADAVPAALDRLNRVLREEAAAGGPFPGAVTLADWAAEARLTDGDFLDAAHFSPEGSRKMAAFVAERVAPEPSARTGLSE